MVAVSVDFGGPPDGDQLLATFQSPLLASFQEYDAMTHPPIALPARCAVLFACSNSR
jgi:hypothetical protein